MNFSFSRGKTQSAALFTSDSITSKLNHEYKARLGHHLVENYPWWERYMIAEHPAISLHDIVVVTECYNTSDWAVASLEGNQSRVNLTCQVGSVGGVSIACAWNCEHSISNKEGPNRTLHDVPRRHAVPWPQRAEYDRYDQNVFIKGWRFGSRGWLSRFKMKAGAGPHTLPNDSDDDDGSSQATLVEEAESSINVSG